MSDRRKKIYIIIIFAIGILSFVITSSQAENKIMSQKITYDATNTTERKANLRISYINSFFEKITENNIQEAFDILDDSSKEEFNNSVEQFKTFATKTLFNDDISKKTYKIIYVKPLEAKEYTDVEYRVLFTLENPEKIDYTNEEHIEFMKNITYEIVLRDYSPNNYKLIISKQRKY